MRFVGDFNSFEWRGTDQNTEHFSHLIGSAALDGKVRRAIILGGQLDYLSDGHLIVSAERTRGGKDQVRLAETTVGILLSINHVEITGARGFDGNPQSIPWSNFVLAEIRSGNHSAASAPSCTISRSPESVEVARRSRQSVTPTTVSPLTPAVGTFGVAMR